MPGATFAQIKALQARTGRPLKDCKEALNQVDCDEDRAAALLQPAASGDPPAEETAAVKEAAAKNPVEEGAPKEAAEEAAKAADEAAAAKAAEAAAAAKAVADGTAPEEGDDTPRVEEPKVEAAEQQSAEV